MWKQVRYEDGNRIFLTTIVIQNDNHPEGLTTGFSGSESTSSYKNLSRFYYTTDYPIYPSIGADWWNGDMDMEMLLIPLIWRRTERGYKIINYDSLIFQGTNLKENDILKYLKRI